MREKIEYKPLHGINLGDIETKKPIKPGEVFVPEKEVATISDFPKSERKARIREVREKLAFQKEGLAKIQAEIIQALHTHPDLTADELWLVARDAGSEYGLNPEQTSILRDVIDEFEIKHEKVREIRAQYPDDADLYEALFDKRPKGKVKIVEGPITLYVRCQNLDDYTFIYSNKFLYNEDIAKEDKVAANLSGGSL